VSRPLDTERFSFEPGLVEHLQQGLGGILESAPTPASYIFDKTVVECFRHVG
jgi:hypothetical protein